MTEIIFADNTPQEMRDAILSMKQIPKMNRRKLIWGKGINDADYVTSTRTAYGNWLCPLYSRWVEVLRRSSGNANSTAYKDTTLHPDWLSFMSFRKWCLDNGWRSDYQLDKDFISDLNVYGPDTCAFIPQALNTFIVDCSATRGSYPIGVSKAGNKFQSHCSNPVTKKGEYLGLFDTPEEAHNAWKQKKHGHALALADMYPDLDPRVLTALKTKYVD
ncbi:hypothetical protein [Aeromonas caviae]|uniref:hypothetical protein n=1 Tax=Aeromonas caviae TaxID=648 RepID=UPI00224EF337|nr:hypothetical protein [Aeromonas caviae]MCX4071949.1 hypothetical protein [Aeromonas caviae]